MLLLDKEEELKNPILRKDNRFKEATEIKQRILGAEVKILINFLSDKKN